MPDYYLVRDSEIPRNYDENGYACSELLPGTYTGGIKNYKCFLKAGSKVSPQAFSDKVVVFFFAKGKGYVCDGESSHNITELAFYAPNFDKAPYEIHAVEDLEYVMSIIELNEWDWKVFNASHVYLPFFRLHSECNRYVQDCKGPHTEARNVFLGKQLGRILLGTTRAVGEGTWEKGHPAVHQWTYAVGNSDFNMCVNHGETIKIHPGDFSFIPAGPDHDLYADPGEEVFYVWYEHFAREKDFLKTQAPD